MTYGYRYPTPQLPNEQPDPAPFETRQLLANARTVAFAPPDACLRTESSCGPLMSALERAAQHAGYEVVPWQSLRGNRPAVELARAANVDVLFLIDDLSLGSLPKAATRDAPTFFERSASGAELPLVVSAELAGTCQQYSAVSDVPPPSRSAAIGIQTISVRDGLTRWRYHDTRARVLETKAPAVTFTAHEKTRASKLVKAMVVVGSVALGAGLSAVIVSQAASASDQTLRNNLDTLGTVGTVAAIGGALLVGGGIALYVHDNHAPGPERVLCNARYATPVEAPPASDGTIDQSLRDEMIAPFVDELVRTHGTPAR